MTLEGTEKLSEVGKQIGPDGTAKQPLTWLGEGDQNITKTAVWKQTRDKNGFKGVALEPMRIRTFIIDYDPESQ